MLTKKQKKCWLVDKDTLTKSGREVLSMLERVCDPEHSRVRKKWSYYTKEEKLDYLVTRNNRKEHVILPEIVPPLETTAPMGLGSLLSSLSALDWCSYNLTELEDAEKKINVILEDIMAAKDLIAEEEKKKELASLMEQRTELDEKINNLKKSLHTAAA